VLPREDQQPASPELPRDELNPATNPLLAQNLGRWAQAYFTNPPEKREQAVIDLLRQLADDALENPPVVSRSASEVRGISEAQLGTVCPRCQHSNHSGSRFCGLCGEEMPSGRRRSARSADESLPDWANPVTSKQAAGGQPELGTADVEETFDRVPVPAIPRNKPAARRLHWTSGIAVVILLTGLVFWRWMSGRHAPASNPGVPPRAATLAQQEPSPSVQAHRSTRPQELAGDSGQTTQTSRVHSSTVAGAQPSSTASAGGVIAPPSRIALVANPTSSSPSPVPETGHGTQELLRARRLLAEQNASRDPAEAAKWLWKAVAKGNASAAIVLANLYRLGDGVPKSCDQARLLLGAAAKNSAAAGEELNRLETSGCQ